MLLRNRMFDFGSSGFMLLGNRMSDVGSSGFSRLGFKRQSPQLQHVGLCDVQVPGFGFVLYVG